MRKMKEDYIQNAVLLLTGTINPNVFNVNEGMKPINVYLVDKNQRLLQYHESIKNYIIKSAFTKIIFVENTGEFFDANKFIELADQYGKKFEFLYHVMTTEQICLMQKKGKSYGEANLIDYGMKHSSLITDAKVVYKATGRAFLTNSQKILWGGVRHNCSEFIIKNKIGWANTEFFRVNKKDYFEYLQQGINCMDDYSNQNIERIWYGLIKDSKMPVTCFDSFPRLHGTIGSANGKNYDKKKCQYFVCDILCRMKYFSIKR